MEGAHVALSKTVAHALRHEPWVYELEPDDEGWVPVTALLSALRGHRWRWADLDRGDIAELVRRSAKQRFELDGDRIRARYGHSLPGRLSRSPADPPPELFHGTSLRAAEAILQHGLRPMGRQYVHLSVDVGTAEQVGRRKSPTPVVLRVAAAQATTEGVSFYRGNDHVWLAEAVPGQYLKPLAA
jgi:putative RNA 2'-phosphotransferase